MSQVSKGARDEVNPKNEDNAINRPFYKGDGRVKEKRN